MAAAAGDMHGDRAIYGARHRLVFPIFNASGDLVTGAAGLDSERSLDQGTFADCANEAVEIATASGMYYLDLTATEMQAKEVTVIVKTSTAGAKTSPKVIPVDRLPIFRSGTAQAGAASTITLDSGAAARDGFYVGMFVQCVNNTPTNVQGQTRRIIAYNGTTKVATVDSNWGTNPSSSTTFDVLLPRDVSQFQQADLRAIEGLGTDTNNATLFLKSLDVRNNGGTAAVFSSSGGNGHGIDASGDGSGSGINAGAGATGNGIRANGGSSSGAAIRALAQAATFQGLHVSGVGSGDGALFEGGSTGDGIEARGGASGGVGIFANGEADGSVGFHAEGGPLGGVGARFGGQTSGSGMEINGGSSGPGLKIRAGASGGDALDVAAQGGNGRGANFAGNGTGAGIRSVGGATAPGVDAVGGATSGPGLRSQAGADGAGAEFNAAGASGAGIRASGAGNGIEAIAQEGSGIYAQAGGDSPYAGFQADGNLSGAGIEATGGGSGPGANFVGNGASAGLRTKGGATGPGTYMEGGATSGAGFFAASIAGPGINVEGATDGINIVGSDGRGIMVLAAGASAYAALELQGNMGGAGLLTKGGDTGHGIESKGGATSGDGANFAALGGAGRGINAAGEGAGAGFRSQGGATGHGFDTRGGATSGDGFHAEATTLGDGIEGVGAGGGKDLNAAEVDSIQTDVDDIQTRLPATLSGGRMRSQVEGMDTDTITSTALAASAVTEIQSGLATSAALASVQADTDAIQVDTATLLARLGAFAGSGVNTVLGLLRAIMRKDVAAPSDVGGTYDPLTDSLEAAADATPSSIIHSGTAQGPGTGNNQIQLAVAASSSDGAYDPALVSIISGTGAGQTRLILQYVGSTRVATVDRNWKINPDVSSVYQILSHPGREHVNEGLAQGGTLNSITLNAQASSSDNVYNGQIIFIRSGTGEDQTGVVTAYNGTTKVATVKTASGGDWAVVPDSTSAYVVLPVSPVVLAGIMHPNAGVEITEALGVTALTSVRNEVAGALDSDTYAEPASVPAATDTLVQKIGFIYAALRNKLIVTSSQKRIRNDADSADIAQASLADNGSEFTKGEYT